MHTPKRWLPPSVACFTEWGELSQRGKILSCPANVCNFHMPTGPADCATVERPPRALQETLPDVLMLYSVPLLLRVNTPAKDLTPRGWEHPASPWDRKEAAVLSREFGVQVLSGKNLSWSRVHGEERVSAAALILTACFCWWR